jgi:hypothetical protein
MINRLLAWLRLSRRDSSWKSADILLLAHQLTVLQRQVGAQPKTSWADRAVIAALLGHPSLTASRAPDGLKILMAEPYDRRQDAGKLRQDRAPDQSECLGSVPARRSD